MTHVRPTITNISRAVAVLDAHPDGDLEHSIADMRRRVAGNLAFTWCGNLYFYGGRSKVTTAMVRAAMAAHGASPATLDLHARAIAQMIRADFTDGGR